MPIGDTAPMSAEQLQVAADDYRITSADALLCAQLRSSMVVCLYDAVGESGAMLHLRLAAPGQSRDPNLTDNTLSGNLSLLTRALREAAGCGRRDAAGCDRVPSRGSRPGLRPSPRRRRARGRPAL
jgi:chemotaxis receptor (MCP) glutamine deamidase CheD